MPNNNEALKWAVEQWNHQVKDRPLTNKHRRTLDDVWRQVIKYHGGDHLTLLGPSHDQLCYMRDNPGATDAPVYHVHRNIYELPTSGVSLNPGL